MCPKIGVLKKNQFARKRVDKSYPIRFTSKDDCMGTMTLSITPTIQTSHKTNTTIAFREAKIQPLMKQFGLVQKENCSILEDWLAGKYAIQPNEKEKLMALRKEMVRYGIYWNEAELEWNFISKLIDLVNYKTDDYHFFWGEHWRLSSIISL